MPVPFSLSPFSTARLFFRPLVLSDAPGMLALDSDPVVHRYLGGIGGNMAATLADSEAVIRLIQAQYAAVGLGRWAVVERASGEFVGWAGLKLVAGPINGQRDFFDLGYRLRPLFWGQGYGSEAALAWRRAGFEDLQLPRLCAYADVRNAASCRILEKIGLQPGNTFVDDDTECRWFEASNPIFG